MPELPEVETIRRGLEQTVTGKRIRRVEVRWPGIVRGSAGRFKKKTERKRIVGTGRRGKYLLVHLSSGRSLVLHLKMSGILRFVQADEPSNPGKHTHIIFHFTDESHLHFSETRKFGFVENIATQDTENYFVNKRMGPEPLDPSFSVNQFIRVLKAHPKTTVKSALLNQQIIAGIGNIYADEALFQAKIRPTRRVRLLTKYELTGLFHAMQSVLREGIRNLGTTLRFYQTIFGEMGGMTDYLKVYGREGKRCERCRKENIKRIVIAGRSSHYCPRCQK